VREITPRDLAFYAGNRAAGYDLMDGDSDIINAVRHGPP
jgi:hypothetical protein